MRLLLLLFPLLGAVPGAGQLPQYHAQVFGAEYGIGGGSILDICQDKEQFIWSTLTNRLQRFDGRNTRNYPFPVTLKSTICDSDNRIWTAGEFQVFRSRNRHAGFEPIPFDTAGNERIRAVFQLPGAPVGLLSNRALYSWREPEKRFVKQDESIPPADPEFSFSRFDTSGTVLFWATRTAFWAYDTRTGQARSLPCQRPVDLCALTPDLALLSDHEGYSYWYDFAAGTVTRLETNHYFPDWDIPTVFRVHGAIPLSATRYLVTSRLGVLLYDRTQDKFTRQRVYAQGKPLEGEMALSRCIAGAQGMFWAQLQTSLVAFTDLHHTLGLLRNFHDEGEQRWSNRIMGLAEDERQNIWLGTNQGFTRLDQQHNRTKTFHSVVGAKDRLSYGYIRGIAYDGQHVVLAPTDRGLWLYDPQTERYRRPLYASEQVREANEESYFAGLYTLRNGDQIAFGEHLFRLDHRSKRLDFLPAPHPQSGYFTVCQDDRGRIWIGTGTEVYGLSEQYELLPARQQMPAGVFSLLAAPGDQLLVGTGQGLCRLDLKAPDLQPDTISTPFDGTMVTMLYADRRGRYWIGTIDGLYLGDEALRVFRKFDYADNIQGSIFSANTSLRAKNGLLFLGGPNGLNYLQPEAFELEVAPLQVTLQSLDINNGDSMIVNLDQPIDLRHWQNMLAVEAIVPYFNNVGKVQYRYLVEGLDAEWVHNGNNNLIRLSGLPAGKYRLRVAASLTGQRWYESGQVVGFTIHPPWWATWYFRLFAFSALLGLITWLVMIREKAWRQRQQERLEIEQLKTTALQYQLETEQVVNYFNTAISNTSSIETALWDVAKNCIARLGFEDCVIYLLDKERNVLQQKAAWGVKSTADDQIVNPIEIPLGRGIVGSVAASGIMAVIGDTTQDPRYIVDDAQRMSELALPIMLDGQVIGVIDSEHSQRHFYTPWHVRIMTTIASLLANKIALSRAEDARQRILLDLVDNQRKAAEAKLQSMRLQMSPHFLFNALNSIQQMILTGNEQSATLYLSKFSKLLRMVLTHSDREKVSLGEELEMLKLYVALEALRFEGAFHYDIRCSDELDPEDCQLPTLLIQPFVENAIWHGLLHKEGPRSLQVLFDANEDDDVVCIVEDNGIGREAAGAYAKRGGGLRRDNHTGKGLSVSAERLQVLNSRTGQQNHLDIEDLFDAAGKASGTRITIVFG